ncbi:MAG: PAS domain S-box protein [Deltaproteobacteria bacterium]|nr:PAS domain S-box protein [Deltaproteobacteria bacterium]
MAEKPTCQDLEQKIKLLEEESRKGKQAEAALRESEQRYRTVVENANEGINIAQDGRLVYMNPKLAEMTGHPFEEVAIRPFADFIHPDDRAMVMDRYWRRLAGQSSPESYEYRTINKAGQVIWLNVSTKKIEWNNKPATLNLLTDITARKEAQEALQGRIRELNCLYSITELVNKTERIEDIYQGAADLMVYGVNCPEITCARIKVRGQEFKTANFAETPWKMSAVLLSEPSGWVEICRLKEMPQKDEGPFLIEERSLLNAVAERLGRVSERKKYEKEREILIEELQEALSEIKQLSGLLPICSSCKKIRNDKDSWEQIEVYIRDHSDAEFTHGLCPECAKKIYPEFL